MARKEGRKGGDETGLLRERRVSMSIYVYDDGWMMKKKEPFEYLSPKLGYLYIN